VHRGRRERVVRPGSGRAICGYTGCMATLLWIIAVVLVIAGIVQIFQRQVVLGIVLIIVGFLVGPGGVSIFAAAGSGLAAGLLGA
jgi:Family of unknown function (DUF5699)